LDRAGIILLVLIAYAVALAGLAVLAQRRTRTTTDFLLGGRQLGGVVAAFSASAASSSVWTLLGVSGYAYTHGLRALWLLPACIGGFCINWYLVAPRLRRAAVATGALTVVDLLTGERRGPAFRAPRRLAVLLLALCLMVYVAQQFRGAGQSLAQVFSIDPALAILIGAGAVLAYTVVGGLWAVSLTDTLQGGLMAVAAVALPLGALLAIGGPSGLVDGLAAIPPTPTRDPWFGGEFGGAWLGVAALLGIGLGYPGQPHVVNFFMATRDERQIRTARRVALTWAAMVYGGMVLLGLCARLLLLEPLGRADDAFLVVADRVFPAVIAAVMLAALLSAILSTADSQILVIGSSVGHDLLGQVGDDRRALRASRTVVLATAVIAVGLALSGTDSLFNSVLFAWTALGAAFGPLLIVTLWRGEVGPRRTMLAMVSGAGLAITAYLIPAAKGTAAERVLPFVVATLICSLGHHRPTRNPAVGP
jgi:sodium/proline symporter